jgi:hypothetical protein
MVKTVVGLSVVGDKSVGACSAVLRGGSNQV